jgi:hypothetical protein
MEGRQMERMKEARNEEKNGNPKQPTRKRKKDGGI